jgi:hypothetical protein
VTHKMQDYFPTFFEGNDEVHQQFIASVPEAEKQEYQEAVETCHKAWERCHVKKREPKQYPGKTLAILEEEEATAKARRDTIADKMYSRFQEHTQTINE